MCVCCWDRYDYWSMQSVHIRIQFCVIYTYKCGRRLCPAHAITNRKSRDTAAAADGGQRWRPTIAVIDRKPSGMDVDTVGRCLIVCVWSGMTVHCEWWTATSHMEWSMTAGYLPALSPTTQLQRRPLPVNTCRPCDNYRSINRSVQSTCVGRFLLY